MERLGVWPELDSQAWRNACGIQSRVLQPSWADPGRPQSSSMACLMARVTTIVTWHRGSFEGREPPLGE